MAKDDKKAAKKKKGGNKKAVILLTLFSLSAIVFLKMTFILFIVGLLPTFVAYYVDNSQSRSLFHSVLACNLAGVIPFVGELWANGNPISMVGMMLSDVQRLFIMYLSAALGWGLMYVCPIAARAMIASINQHNIQKLKYRQRRLVEEWGQDVSSAHHDSM